MVGFTRNGVSGNLSGADSVHPAGIRLGGLSIGAWFDHLRRQGTSCDQGDRHSFNGSIPGAHKLGQEYLQQWWDLEPGNRTGRDLRHFRPLCLDRAPVESQVPPEHAGSDSDLVDARIWILDVYVLEQDRG